MMRLPHANDSLVRRGFGGHTFVKIDEVFVHEKKNPLIMLDKSSVTQLRTNWIGSGNRRWPIMRRASRACSEPGEASDWRVRPTFRACVCEMRFRTYVSVLASSVPSGRAKCSSTTFAAHGLLITHELMPPTPM